MACCQKEAKYGYDDSRFENVVDENFHCSLCNNVLKEPRMCRNNEHIFCRACISEHLMVNSETCPECDEHLSLDTLRKAPQVLRNCLSKLKINCDHASRGCPQFTCLEELETHVSNCGYAPVMCSNAECGMEINKQDKVHHETEVCEYRRVKCQSCEKMQEVVGRLEGKMMELDRKVAEVRGETKKEVEKIGNTTKYNGDKVEAVYEEIKIASRQTEHVKKEVGEVKEEVKDVKENLSKVNKDVNEVKVMMSQVLEKLDMLEHLNKLPSPTEGMLNTPREDILIAGGYGGTTGTEIFSWEKNGWFEVSPMNKEHDKASSFIYEDQLFVAGGAWNGTTETLDLNVLPLKWREFPTVLPFSCWDHQTVVCQQTVFLIGGCNWGNEEEYEDELSYMISEVHLTQPNYYPIEQLCPMSEPRMCHGAEVFEDKVLILGGCDYNDFTLDSVLEFDPKRNDCKEMPKLPVALSNMATVRWHEETVVIGGVDRNGYVVNDVYMYNMKTGKITVLPSMLEKRSGCCAVITRDIIVVMGGRNEKDERLNSVECFTMGCSSWEYLPAMNKERDCAIAEVLPHGRKYV